MTAMLIHGGGAQHLLVALMLIGLSPGPAGLLLRAPPSCTSALTSARDPATKTNKRLVLYNNNNIKNKNIATSSISDNFRQSPP